MVYIGKNTIPILLLHIIIFKLIGFVQIYYFGYFPTNKLIGWSIFFYNKNWQYFSVIFSIVISLIFDKISSDMVAAMKAKDKVRLMALRTVKKYFIEAKTAPGASDELSDDEAIKILAKLAKQGRDTADIYVGQSRQDLADEELAQVAVIEEYLPRQLSIDELRAELQTIIAQVGASGPKDMGKVMGQATKALVGRAEGKVISAMVRDLLT